MAQFASDAFGGSDGTALETYNSAWTRHTAYSTAQFTVSNGARVYGASASGLYYHSGAPAGADYSVSVDVYARSTTAGTGVGPVGRVSASANTGYHGRYNAGFWQLYKFVAGAFTQLGSSYAQTLSGGASYVAKLEMEGTAIRLYVDGVSRVGPITDSAVSDAGKAGLRVLGGTFSNTAGLHLDNFSADDLGATGIPTLSAATVMAITANSATPRVTLTF